MRRLLLSMLLASAASVSLAADNASLSGKWKVHSNVAGNESDLECTFTQKDNDLSGTCTTDGGDKNLTGKVDGTKSVGPTTPTTTALLSRSSTAGLWIRMASSQEGFTLTRLTSTATSQPLRRRTTNRTWRILA